MKKSLLGWAFAAMLTACGGTEGAEPNIVTDEEGHSVILQEGENVSRELESFSDDNPNAMPMGAGCWVVLDWCRDPEYGLGICHQNGKCTQKQFREACINLYKKNC
ncbi:hypothetical protein [Melittangium boletus]|uniref:Lipoprotein n=1 Tax=Melittangium boletus DSM 14713 TaxID=1294270 RepID=A0A250I938_9BACT|nr:hypothetical protein [Melittangium boletus]ATB28379.1 hypothetical protein MEBOL_001825 [Melittangium boletus DSM 14713]